MTKKELYNITDIHELNGNQRSEVEGDLCRDYRIKLVLPKFCSSRVLIFIKTDP